MDRFLEQVPQNDKCKISLTGLLFVAVPSESYTRV